MAIFYGNHLPHLKEAFSSGNMTFFLGAGVSKDNGLPGWEELVQALYFSTLNDEAYIYHLRPYPNYLFAIAGWVLRQKNEPLDIIIRKIKQWYDDQEFINMLRKTLYAGFLGNGMAADPGISQHVIDTNATLEAIIKCCRLSIPRVKGLNAIVTYNYDNLVELGLDLFPEARQNFQIIYKVDQKPERDRIPVYHVHGYLPFHNANIDCRDILLSEEQYNRAFQDPFYWGNVVQVNQFTNSTGLMIGLSLSDRNTRRILDSIRNQPVRNDNYILMRRPRVRDIRNEPCEIEWIRTKAYEYRMKYRDSGLKEETKESAQIQYILEKIYEYENLEFDKGFENIGLNLIKFDEFSEIPEIINEISSGN